MPSYSPVVPETKSHDRNLTGCAKVLDAAGNLTRQTNFNGVVLTNQYDALNRLTNRTSAGGYQVRWTHTATGQRATMVDASGTNTYAYDTRGRLLTNATPQGTLTYTYDAFGNLATIKSLTSGGIALTNTFDSLNRLATVAQASGTASYTYDAVGNLETLRLPNAVTNTWAYNALNRLTNLTVTAASGTLGSFAYKLAPAGSRTNLSETVNAASRTFSWQYDPLYRLTNETITGTAPTGAIGYKYDAVGNRTNRTSTVSGLTNQTSTYTVNDRLTTDSYDPNGNTTNSAGNTYRYDAENRLTNAIVGGTSVIYVYDGDGNRVRKIVGTTTNTYLVDTRNLTGYAQVLEESVNGSLSKVYAYGVDLIGQRDAGAGTTYYFGQDGLGSTRLLTTTNGTVANAFAYDAFGTLIASNAAPQTDYLFTGEQRDANLGFYSLRARYLNPATGRFWTRDTYAGNQYDPPSLHRYTYAHNDPVNGVDPSGQQYTAIGSLTVLVAITIVVTYAVYSATPQGRSANQQFGYAVYAALILPILRSVTYELEVFSSKHTEKTVDGLLAQARPHAEKLQGYSPGGVARGPSQPLAERDKGLAGQGQAIGRKAA